MKTKEIRERETDALQQELKDRQKHMFDLRTQAVTEKLEDPTQLLKTRRDIARLKTVLRQRQLEASPKVAKKVAAKVKAERPKAPKRTPKRRKTKPGAGVAAGGAAAAE
jgi:large subunit ribosomal protein L29